MIINAYYMWENVRKTCICKFEGIKSNSYE
jgi:hypothetical protein